MPSRYIRVHERDNVAIIADPDGASAGKEFPGGLVLSEMMTKAANSASNTSLWITGRYRRIYKGLSKIARQELMKRIKAVPPRLPSSCPDRYSSRMKAVFEEVWGRLESTVPNLDPIKAKLPRDLWDPEVPLKWPAWFGLRVFRRMDMRPEPHSWHKSKAAHRERHTKKLQKQRRTWMGTVLAFRGRKAGQLPTRFWVWNQSEAN